MTFSLTKTATSATAVLSRREKIGYGLGDAASHIVFDSSVAILAYFYTNIYGLSPAAMGTMFLLVRVLDAITDPIMGSVADATHTRWGRFRPYMLAVCIPFGLSCVLVYTTPDYGATGKMVYATLTYIFMILMYTAINIPYCSLGAALTADPKDNLSLQSYRFAITPIGGALGTACILPLADWLFPADRAAGIQAAMAIFGAIGCLMFVVCFATTQERVQPVKEENMNILRDLKLLWQNDQWRILSVYNFTMLTALVIRGGVLVYYVNYIMQRGADIVSIFMLAATIASMGGSLLAKPIGNRFDKIRSSVWINVLNAAVGMLFLVVPQHYWQIPFVLYVLVCILQGANGPLQWAMITDANNYGEWKTQRRITGMNVAANIFIIKLGVAVGGACIGWGLALFGYQAGVEQQSASAIQGVLWLFSAVPSVLYLLTAVAIHRYTLTENRVSYIVNELAAGRFQQGQGSAETIPDGDSAHHPL